MENRLNLNPKKLLIAAIVAIVAVTYICIAKISLLVATVYGSVAAIWPISGLAIGGALLLGYPVIWGVFIGSLILGFSSRELAALSALTTVVFALANSLEAIVAVVLLDRFVGSRNWLVRSRDLFKFIGLSVVFSPAVSATIATLTLVATRQVAWNGGAEIWTNWWVSNAVGILVFTPLIVAWGRQNQPPHQRQMIGQQKIEFLLLVGLLLAINILAFLRGYPIEYMLVLPLIWAAFRFPPQIVTLLVVAIISISAIATANGYGSFVRDSPGESLVLLQSFIGAIAISALVLSALVSEHKKTQLQLQKINSELEERIQRRTALLLEAQRVAHVGNWEYDLETGQITWSEEVFHIFGLNPTQETPDFDQFQQLIHPEDREIFLTAIARVIETKQPAQFDYRIVRPDGSIRFAEAKTKPLVDSEGRVTCLFGTVLDMTQRKQTEEAFKTSEERYRTLFEANLDAVMLLDENILIDCNEATLKMFGCTDKSEFIGRHPSEFSPEKQPDGTNSQQRAREIMMRLDARQDTLRFEWLHQRLNGEQFLADVCTKATLLGERNIWQVVVRDISDRKAYERQLQEAKTAADMANQAKSEFLANMSHELRTPLNGILGYTQILERADDLNQHRHGIDIIRQCGTHLLNLINDILDLSKIEARKMELYPKEFHFLSFVTSVAEMIRIRAQNKGIEFTYIGDPQLPAAIIADEKRLGQILINLLGNAVKFTDTGGVTFRVEVTDSTPKTVRLRFGVEDTGVGMNEEQIETIFRPFEQVGAISRRAEGSGLGLTISQKLLAMMGSTIEVSSRLGGGSCFSFELEVPLADDWVSAVTQVEGRKIVGYEGSRRKLLVVDDKAVNRTIIMEVLDPLGFDCHRAENGEEGLAVARELQPDLILTDLVMPVLDGFEMTRRLRQDPRLKNTIIIASSASVLQQDQVQSLEAGCDDFIPKPIEFDRLLEILQKYLNLEWIYETYRPSRTDDNTPEDVASDEWVLPPAEALMVICEAAKIGDIEQIEREVQRIKISDQRYVPFCDRVSELALNFEDHEIVNLIESHLPPTSRD
ncbi:MASE1 domain-containing protein [Lyngbya sp. CCY1209]|uniref:MASE1 domain-containing protein n=1 Tax=Lyngbya sp. CCY1209 TaxID=2886103 RepID=UPI002D1FC4E5|nr:MASE1 domain-containing protein [Lyngbya sp. CCY1209]MEB3884205.1 MASE1 domain-containing protein [Lyngbya sp. CCY1209]